MAQQYRVNRQIRAPQVRLIDQDSNQVGVIDAQDARRRAEEAQLDLVEVSPHANPPVCRIMDFGKFKYAQRKKERGSHKVSSKLKELRVRPAIDKHDLSYRLERGRKFLEQGHKVQVVCIFRGRQMAHPQMGYDVMNEVAEQLSDLAKVEARPRMSGNRMTMMLARRLK